jgi:hypothetical protein
MSYIYNFAVLDASGKVTNIILADDEYASQNGLVYVETDVNHPDFLPVSIGWSHNGFVFSPPPRDIIAERAEAVVKRNQLLDETNEYVVADVWAALSPEEQTAWATYRQTLRTIVDPEGDPADIIWPTSPLES